MTKRDKMDNNNDWQVGDKVLIYKTNSILPYRMSCIEKITPSGLIKVDDCLYHPNGKPRTTNIRDISHIVKATPEMIADFEEYRFKRGAIFKLRNLDSYLNFDDISCEQLREVLKILNIKVY